MNRKRRRVHSIMGKAINLAHDTDIKVLGPVSNFANRKSDGCGKERTDR